MTGPASLQLLFADLTELTPDALAAAVRDYHPSLATAAVELGPGDRGIAGVVAWGEHVVRLAAFDSPMPPNAAESCLRPALLPPEFKADARRHKAHALLYYAGRVADPLEQLVALGCVAGPLTRLGAVATLNEEARAAVAAFALLPDADREDMLATLRGLPVPFLYGGFVKMELTDVPGVWVRTFACPRLNLPNLAYHAPGHADGERLFHLFSGVLGYLRETGLAFEPGELVRIDESQAVRVREPADAEWWLESDGPIWVLEPVEAT